jgi:hypothetical protein
VTTIPSREITAAVALALEDSREFTVSSTTDLEREMTSLGIHPPLSVAEQVRVGQRLRVEKVLTGALAVLNVDSRTGRAQVEVRLMMLDVAVGEYLDGAVVSIVSKAIPGWSGDANQVMGQALREGAEAAVTRMLSARVRRGNVDMVDDLGNVNTNLGTNDGMELGSELLVMRPTWQPDVEEVILRRVGVIRISDVEANLSMAQTVEGAIPTTGDKVFRLYKPVGVAQAEAKSRRIKGTGQMLGALLLLLGLVAVAGGPTSASPSRVGAALTQARPGENPSFAVTADYLIDMLDGRRSEAYSDDVPFRSVEDKEVTFQFMEAGTGGEGTQTDATVTVSYNDPALERGIRYYYRVRRIIEPLLPPGSNPPIATAQVALVVPVITLAPDSRILSDPSPAAGPITYFTPPVQIEPANGAANQRNQSVQFTWQPSQGANEYLVEIFPNSDPDGLLSPIIQSPVIRQPYSTTLNYTFTANQTYWWRVGARQTGDQNPPVNQLTGRSGWLYSAMRSFATAPRPPDAPGTSHILTPVRAGQRGWWGSDRSQRR